MIGHGAREGIGGILTAGVGPRIRIDEQQYPAAPHHELIDGVQGLGRQFLRMNQHQDVHVLVDAVDVAISGRRVKQFLKLGDDGPGFAHLARHRIELSLQPQGTHEADDGLPRRRELIDELDDVVLQKFFAIGLEARNRGAPLRGVRCRSGRNTAARRRLPAATAARTPRRGLRPPEKGCGSITRRRIFPPARADSSSRNSLTRFA